ncbi:MAG: hypothetical protein ABI885_16580 [Gammaproteobacteria bacterium]
MNARPSVAVAFALFAVILSGCVSVQSTRLGSGTIRPPLTPDHVAIYRTSEQVGARYEEVAILSASGDHSYTNEEQMYAGMRKKAGALGANGVILESVTEPTTGAKVAQAFLGTPASRRGRAIAIYVHNSP